MEARIDKEDADLPASERGVVEPTLAEKEAAYEKFVWDNLKRNYIGNYLHGMLGMTGFRLINAPTFLPAYLHMISGSNTIVGLGLALQQVGSVISPIFGATQIEHRSKSIEKIPTSLLIDKISYYKNEVARLKKEKML